MAVKSKEIAKELATLALAKSILEGDAAAAGAALKVGLTLPLFGWPDLADPLVSGQKNWDGRLLADLLTDRGCRLLSNFKNSHTNQ